MWSAVGYTKQQYIKISKRLHKKIRKIQKGGGGGAVILQKRDGIWCVVVLRERAGIYVGQYNIPCGKHTTDDVTCVKCVKLSKNDVGHTIVRETFEEFVFALTGDDKPTTMSDSMIPCNVIDDTALIQIGTGAGTVLACVLLNTPFSRADVNRQMAINNKKNIGSEYQEMDGVELVPIANILKLPRDGKPHSVNNLTDSNGVTRVVTLSSFAIAAVQDFHDIGCF